ncbi:MAG: hypothetical protein M3406_10425 [Chloroflexota bacterium]|nr:hypothetical protein [Chloroflexota bacterium]
MNKQDIDLETFGRAFTLERGGLLLPEQRAGFRRLAEQVYVALPEAFTAEDIGVAIHGTICDGTFHESHRAGYHAFQAGGIRRELEGGPEQVGARWLKRVPDG